MAERRQTVADRILARWRILAAILTGVIVVNCLAHALVIRRTGAVSGDRNLILKAASERTDAARAEADGLMRTASKLACAKSDVAMVFDDLLSSKEERMTAIQREVRALARDRGLDPARIAYTATEVKDTGLVRFTISFPLQGTYETLEDFVKAVEESANFLIIEQITMDEAEPGKLSLRVELATYFQAPDADRVARRLAAGGRS